MTYDDVHINFTQEEWVLLDLSQKRLYKDVILETYRNLTAIGYKWEEYNIEEYCQNSRIHGRQERSHPEDKLYEYRQCGKVFACHSHLQSHERIRAGEESCECNQCNNHSTLQNPEKNHTEERLYECNECGKAFSQQSHLQIHTRTHHGQKLYECLLFIQG